jgi:hypothetical protein
LIGEVGKIAAAMPNDRIALQWDVCQEVLAWEGYYETGLSLKSCGNWKMARPTEARGCGGQRCPLGQTSTAETYG